MDIEELNHDRRLASASQKIDDRINRGFSKEAESIVTTSAWLGGIVFALPLFGFDNIIYAIVLWNMYAQICSLVKKKFGDNLVKSFAGAFIVNLLVSSLIEFVVSLLPVAGIIAAFFVGFLSIKISGAAYLKALEIAHNGNVADRYDFNRVINE